MYRSVRVAPLRQVIAALEARRIELDVLVEVAVARRVVVDADDVGRTLAVEEEVEFLLTDPVLHKDGVPRVAAVDTAE